MITAIQLNANAAKAVAIEEAAHFVADVIIRQRQLQDT